MASSGSNNAWGCVPDGRKRENIKNPVRKRCTNDEQDKTERTVMKYAILFSILLLAGCATTSPTQEIIKGHVELVDAALKKDVVTKDDLKACRAGLLSAEQSYKAEIRSYVAEKAKWKITSALLGILLAVAIFMGVKR